MSRETNLDPSVMLATAESAVEYARAVRKTHARKSPRISKQRRIDLKLALDRLAGAMRPIRRALARLPVRPLPTRAEEQLREASQDIQRERRKLWKMNRPVRRKN